MRRVLQQGAAALLVLVLAGCSTRSISSSGYPGDPHTPYLGELLERDLIPLPDGPAPDDRAIAAALSQGAGPTARLGQRLILIQSGAAQPDAALIEAFSAAFPVEPFSGLPPSDHEGLARRLRYVAAQGGVGQILCVWGQLEAEREGEATKLVSWVPLVGDVVPDESQHMRIQLRAVLLDVATGRWRMITPAPDADDRTSAGITRRSSDQGQVARLKQAGYHRLAQAVVDGAS